jgi:hypothetical protein
MELIIRTRLLDPDELKPMLSDPVLNLSIAKKS